MLNILYSGPPHTCISNHQVLTLIQAAQGVLCWRLTQCTCDATSDLAFQNVGVLLSQTNLQLILLSLV